MKVRVVGSGSMWTAYNSASYLIDDSIIIDFPNGMCKYLFRQGIDPRAINNVIITHFHGDHYFDIPFYYLLKSRSDNKAINLYCGKEGKRKIKKLFALAFPNSVKRVKESIDLKYHFNKKFKIDKYEISRVLMDHGRMKPAYGYILTDDKIKVGFTGDTTLCDNVKYLASMCDYLFCDCMFIEGTSKHMGIDMLKKLSSKYKNCTFVVSHLEDDTRYKLNKLDYNNVIVPEDGVTITIM